MNQKTIVAARAASLVAGVILGLATAKSTRASEDDPPLSLARDGFFYVGGKNTIVNGHTYVVGQMYVEMRIPTKQTHRFPIIMVHGGTRTGTTYTGTPDGRESWRNTLLAAATPSMWWTNPDADAPAIWRKPMGRRRWQTAKAASAVTSSRRKSSSGPKRICIPNGRAAARRMIRSRCR